MSIAVSCWSSGQKGGIRDTSQPFSYSAGLRIAGLLLMDCLICGLICQRQDSHQLEFYKLLHISVLIYDQNHSSLFTVVGLGGIFEVKCW